MSKTQEMGLTLAMSDVRAERWYKRSLRMDSRCLVCGRALPGAEHPDVYLSWIGSLLNESVATVCAEHGKPETGALDLYLHGPCFEADHGRAYEVPV